MAPSGRLWGFYGPRETDVACPSCQEGKLSVRISCMNAAVVCPRCNCTFTLSELSERLTAEEFAILGDAVGDRFSDRI